MSRPLVRRARTLSSGVLVVFGLLLAVVSVAAAAHGLRGYLDVFSFLATLGLAAAVAWLGWELSA